MPQGDSQADLQRGNGTVPEEQGQALSGMRMMPNRIIREGVLFSERYHELGLEARLLFFELLLSADDYGLVHLSPAWLRMHCPIAQAIDRGRLLKLIAELCDAHLLITYQHLLITYGYIPRFGNAPRARRPKFPIPPDSLGGNEIKDLMQKLHSRCSADAVQMHGVCSGSALETETETALPNSKPMTEVNQEESKSKSKAKAPPAPKRASAPLPVNGQNLPDWLPAEPWEAWVDMRKRIRKPLTPRAEKLAVTHLAKLRDLGHDPAVVLDQSTMGNWTGLYEEHAAPKRKPQSIDDVLREIASRDEE